MRLPIALALLTGLTAADVRADVDARRAAFFEAKIRPVLIEHCAECHSADSNDGDGPDGGLRLDSREGWVTGGDSGAAVVPGDVDGSLLIEAVRYDGYEMPPAGRLPDDVVADLERWVRDGAFDPRVVESIGDPIPDDAKPPAWEEAFWAFEAVASPAVPGVADEGWSRSPIDRFLLARMEAEGLSPGPDADPAARLRRLHFDLTGLPPTAEEVAAFLADPSDRHWERSVDRLLASPAFGETWGRHWLDVARYADSNGGDFNATFHDAWRYRDYVLAAFNNDLPFDRFLRQQIAGDLLPAATDMQRTRQVAATGFLALGAKMLSERDKPKLRMDVVDEQVDTLYRAVTGLTVGCARCHDHKFDPIPARDYYALAGIFRGTETLRGEFQQYVSSFPRIELPIAPEHAAALAGHARRAEELADELAAAKARLAEAGLLPPGTVLVDDAEAVAVGTWTHSTHSPGFVGTGYLHDDQQGKGTKSLTFPADLPAAGEYEVRFFFAHGGSRSKAVPVTVTHAGGAVEEVRVDQRKKPPLSGRAVSLGTFAFDAGPGAEIVVSNAGTSGHVIADAVAFVPTAGSADADAAGLAVLEQAVKDLEAAIEAHTEIAPPPAPTALAVAERPPGECADIPVHIRGEVGRFGEVVPRGSLTACGGGPLEISAGSGRLELARRLTDPAHPLTGRVIVNRVWAKLLGEGIVRTVDNFGRLGERPTHPELLDHLASTFTADGWRVKRLVRRVVFSRAYSLAAAKSGADDPDPENRLLAHAHRRVIPAESLRDAMLSAAGLLRVGRPAASPVAGYGRTAVALDGSEGVSLDGGGAVRSVYLATVRNVPRPVLATFDAADPEFVTGRRPHTTVPAQTLFLANSPDVRRWAAAAAAKLMGDDRAKARTAVLRCLGREPTDAEGERFVGFIAAGGTWTDVVHTLFASTEFRFLE